MLTTNVLKRVFHIRWHGDTAACFAIDIDGRQYIVTARHFVEDYVGGPIEIQRGGQWTQIDCQLVGHAEGNTDISVLAASVVLTDKQFDIEMTSSELALGQAVYFLGFPHGEQFNIPYGMNAGYPLPLVKGGLLSALPDFQSAERLLWLDGQNNLGFSGGPVVFRPKGDSSLPFRIAGVVSAYPAYPEPVFTHSGDDTGNYVEANSGFVFAYCGSHACELIAQNPVGVIIE